MAYSPDGKILASGGTDGKIKLWDVETGKNISSVVAHKGYVACLAFSPNGKSLVSGGDDNLIKLWSVRPEK